ncbi:MAG: type I methionyl aminopeptidase [Patescibacteria group bacterium]
MAKIPSDFEDCGLCLSEIFRQTLLAIKPGKRLSEINQLAEDLIAQSQCQASFKTVKDYQWATCLNLNAGIVHGIPDQKVVRRGDLVSLDLGIFGNWHTDMAYTIEVETNKQSRLLDAGRLALDRAIATARSGNRVGDISLAIQETIEGAGYTLIKELVGHGVGQSLHQTPWIPGVLMGPIEQTPLLEEGMALAIEVIYTSGQDGTRRCQDGWTIETRDGRISALFEKTILVAKNGGKQITPFTWERQ